MALASAFVPMKHQGVIYLRPPVGWSLATETLP
jgi:hypothetical protein